MKIVLEDARDVVPAPGGRAAGLYAILKGAGLAPLACDPVPLPAGAGAAAFASPLFEWRSPPGAPTPPSVTLEVWDAGPAGRVSGAPRRAVAS